MDRVEHVRTTGQLTYTSFESASGRGGWQVKQVRGGLVPEVVDALQSSAVASLPTPPRVDRFASADEVAGWPRRLAYHPLDAVGSGTRVAMHSASAGEDRSGRFGNVFSHAALLPTDSLSHARPAQLWRSPSWLVPYGPEAVHRAEATNDEFSVGELPATVNAFLESGENWRPGLLVVLLDAVRAAFSGGPAVALVVSDTDEAAGWVKAVSACMSWAMAARFGFSTLETVAGAELWAKRHLRLVCLLRADVTDLRALGSRVVIDAAEDAVLGAPGGEPHRTRRGDEVESSVWSSIFLERYSLTGDVSPLVAELDALCDRLGGAESSDPGWLTALSGLLRGDTSSMDAARLMVVRSAPASVERDPEVAQVVADSLRLAMGASTAERRAALGRMHAEGASAYMLRLAAAVYAESAFGDPDWFPGPGPVLLEFEVRPVLRDGAKDAFLRLSQGEGSGDWLSDFVGALRVVDLVHALGWHSDPQVEGGIERLLEKPIGRVFDAPHRAQLAFERAVPTRPETVELLRDHALTFADAATLPVLVLTSLGMLDEGFLDSPLLVVEDGNSLTPLGVRIAAELLDQSLTSHSVASRLVVHHALWGLAQERADLWHGVYRQRLKRLMRHPIPIADVHAVTRMVGRSLPDEVACRALLESPLTSAGLRELAHDLVHDGADHDTRGLAQAVRTMVDGQWASARVLPHMNGYARALAVGISRVRALAGEGWTPDPGVLQVGAVWATLCVLAAGGEATHLQPLRDAPASREFAAEAAPLVSAFLSRRGDAAAAAVAMVALMRMPGPLVDPTQASGREWCRTCGVVGEAPGWADLLLAEALRTLPDLGQRTDRAIDAHMQELERRPLHPDDVHVVERNVRAWFRTNKLEHKARTSIRDALGFGRGRVREER